MSNDDNNENINNNKIIDVFFEEDTRTLTNVTQQIPQ